MRVVSNAMVQRAIDALQAVLDETTYKPGWTFGIKVPGWPIADMPMLHIGVTTIDSTQPGNIPIQITHGMDIPIVPEWGLTNYRRWLLDRVLNVESHEAMEFFKAGGVPVYYPHHESGQDPYELPRGPWL